MCGTRVCVVRTSVLVVVERAHHSTPWLHSFIHSFIHSTAWRHAASHHFASHRTYGSVAVSRASPRSKSPWRLPSARTSRVRECRRTTAADDRSIHRCARATRPLIYTHNFTHHTPPRPVQTLRVPLPWFTTRQPGSRVAPPRSRRLDRRHIGGARERRVCSSIGRARALQRRRMRCV